MALRSGKATDFTRDCVSSPIGASGSAACGESFTRARASTTGCDTHSGTGMSTACYHYCCFTDAAPFGKTVIVSSTIGPLSTSSGPFATDGSYSPFLISMVPLGSNGSLAFSGTPPAHGGATPLTSMVATHLTKGGAVTK